MRLFFFGCHSRKQVNDIWYSAVPGDEVTKTAAKESLAREWEARFRVPSTDYEQVRQRTAAAVL